MPFERPTSKKDQFRMIFDLNEQYQYNELDDAYIFFKLCKKLELKIIISVERMVKLFSTPIPTNDLMMQIEASGDEESIARLKKLWKKSGDRGYVKENYLHDELYNLFYQIWEWDEEDD